MSAGRTAARAAAYLQREGAWIEQAGGSYHLRLSPDRRRRPTLSFGEELFKELVRAPGLRALVGGGYALARTRAPAFAGEQVNQAGAPGRLLGKRPVMEPDGAMRSRAANLGESPAAWLARRKDAKGRPWLTPPQLAAAEKLRGDWIAAGQIGRLTMVWDAGPKQVGPRGPGLEPAERARAARERLHNALAAMGPGLQEIVERTCLLGQGVEAAEKALNLPRRAGKALLRLALDRLAAHYRIG
ncbi:MAG TPA: DUF6456 domain-containing protein [Caulobacteraceae bacterium]|jgi:hypothetical protein